MPGTTHNTPPQIVALPEQSSESAEALRQLQLPERPSKEAVSALTETMKYSSISTTADPTAVNRALFTQLPYAKEIAQAMGANVGECSWDKLKWKMLAFTVPAYAANMTILEGRYRATDEALELLKPRGVLELAAGFLPRGLAMASHFDLYIESDQQDVIARKEVVCDALAPSRDRTRHRLRAVDVLQFEQVAAAGQLFEDAGVKDIAIIHEGLFYYLARDEQTRLRDNITAFLARFNPDGAWITPDFVYRLDADIMSRRVRKHFETLAGRPWSTFHSDEEVRVFLNEGGLDVRFLPNDHLAGTLSTERILGLRNKEHAARWLQEVRVGVVTLAK